MKTTREKKKGTVTYLAQPGMKPRKIFTVVKMTKKETTREAKKEFFKKFGKAPMDRLGNFSYCLPDVWKHVEHLLDQQLKEKRA